MNLTTGQLDSLSILVHDLTDETLQALSVATGSALKALFIISMASFEWTQLMAVVGTTWACLRRLHLYWAPLTRGETEPAKLDDWIGPLHHFQQLTVLNVPQEIFQRLVVRDGPLDVNLRPDAVMKLTQACPTLRLLTCFGIFTNRARAALLYIRPMEEPAEQIEPNEPFVTDYTEEHATTLHLRAEVLSTSHVWRLYLIEGPTNQHLWKRFLPHWDSIKFADE
ncbi:hypothetical protein FRB90_012082 [Tulasnella sp. 427]|nr:hypothetical protein FRB90_012082 [Tulasnella sp. 427]